MGHFSIVTVIAENWISIAAAVATIVFAFAWLRAQ
jgi:hypothetical protein